MAKLKIPVKRFEDWQYEEIGDEFGLTRFFKHTLLDELLALPPIVEHAQMPMVLHLQSLLVRYADSWNEDELKFMFISPFISLANYDSPHYKIFTQRPMRLNYANGTKTTTGRVEFMVAKGIQTPKKPYFFLHEYKTEKRRENDPLGQVLIAMVAARFENNDPIDLPIYGAFVWGRFWQFVVLQGSEYAVTNTLNAADEDVFKIFAILCHFKTILEERYTPKT